VLRLAHDTEPPPSVDDLLALADLVREAARPQPPAEPPIVEPGRRGHLRIIRDTPE
jgi:hypothetical protein